jgi:hypothetical protein
MMSISRLWRLEFSENIYQIEKDFDNETSDNLPM